MIYMSKKIIAPSIFFLALMLSLFFIVAPEGDAAEDAGAALTSQNIVTGKMDEYSRSFIIVDNVRYGFCNGIKFFNMNNKEIPLRDIDAALEVELYESNGCIEKIIVLRFAY